MGDNFVLNVPKTTKPTKVEHSSVSNTFEATFPEGGCFGMISSRCSGNQGGRGTTQTSESSTNRVGSMSACAREKLFSSSMRINRAAEERNSIAERDTRLQQGC